MCDSKTGDDCMVRGDSDSGIGVITVNNSGVLVLSFK